MSPVSQQKIEKPAELCSKPSFMSILIFLYILNHYCLFLILVISFLHVTLYKFYHTICFKELLQRIKFCLLPSENFHHPRQNMRKFFETNIITLYHQQHTCTSITLWEKQWHRNVKKYANMYICDNIFHDTMYTQIPCNYFLFKLSWISKILFWWNISTHWSFVVYSYIW